LISGRYVTIQNVGLRSTAAMTREGTDISFPNGMLVQNSIENLSRRNRFLILTTLGLSSRCSLEQVQYVIARVREMLYSHSRVEQRTARFRMTGVQGLAYNVELFAYVLTGNYADFAAIQEDIFFRITRIVESAGASWAIPGQLSFPTPNQLIDEDKAASAQRVVQEWQDKRESPFPDFSDDRIAHLRGSISYPPHSSDPPTKNENPFKKAV
jgi:MscS family membrane protein